MFQNHPFFLFHLSSTPPAEKFYEFDMAIGLAPNTLSFSPPPAVIYILAKPGTFLRERSASQLLATHKMMQELTEYYLKHYGEDLLILIHGPTPRLIKQLVNIFVNPSTIPYNPLLHWCISPLRTGHL